MDPQELARKNDEAAKSNLQEELALLEEKIKLATMNNKSSITNIQEEAIIPEKALDPQEVVKRKEEAAVVMKQSLEKWNSEKEKNEEEIEKIRKRKEERKREMEEEQALLLSMKKEDEAAAAREEEEEEKIKIEIDHKEVLQEKTKQNFSDQKKFKTKEVQEYEEAICTFIRPFDVTTMDVVQLKEKASELYEILANLKNDKINLSKRMAEQDCLSKNLRDKLCILLDDKASKKGFIDMEKYYPGKTGHSVKKAKKENYVKEKPDVLANVWEEKFNAWMNSEQVDGRDEE